MHADLSHRFFRAVSADEVPRLNLADDLEVGKPAIASLLRF
jgi:hypothetical protein